MWVRADAPAQRLWTTEQLIKGNSAGAIVAWLPQARAEQIRRLQVCAQACEGPVFLFRPTAAQHEASAASLRVMATFALDWEIQVHVLKRRGPTHEGLVRLRSVPGGLEAVLTPRLQMPSRLIATREGAPRDGTHHAPARPALSEGAARPVVHEAAVHALGGATPSARARRRATVR